MGTTPGQTRPDAGRRKRRPRRPQYSRPRDLVTLALKGPASWGEAPVSTEQWEALRVPTWERWLDDADRAWPPHAARHDGIVGDALRRSFNPPEGYVGGFDARPRIVALADTALAEVARFRKANPTAAKSIAEPLREYARLLREIRDHPVSRLLRPGSSS